jgi:hypothetical protein
MRMSGRESKLFQKDFILRRKCFAALIKNKQSGGEPEAAQEFCRKLDLRRLSLAEPGMVQSAFLAEGAKSSFRIVRKGATAGSRLATGMVH